MVKAQAGAMPGWLNPRNIFIVNRRFYLVIFLIAGTSQAQSGVMEAFWKQVIL
jgi:hypothetical protein